METLVWPRAIVETRSGYDSKWSIAASRSVVTINRSRSPTVSRHRRYEPANCISVMPEHVCMCRRNESANRSAATYRIRWAASVAIDNPSKIIVCVLAPKPLSLATSSRWQALRKSSNEWMSSSFCSRTAFLAPRPGMRLISIATIGTCSRSLSNCGNEPVSINVRVLSTSVFPTPETSTNLRFGSSRISPTNSSSSRIALAPF